MATGSAKSNGNEPMSSMVRFASRLFLPLSLALLAQAHVGSPDIYLDGKAGPYQLFVTVRPPMVIPGVAEIEIRSDSPGIRNIRAVPVPMAGPGARFAPVADRLAVSPQDARLFTGSLWMMAPGSWQVRISVDGAQGSGELAIPVPSAARATKKMQSGLGILLSALGLFLVAGVVAMAGATEREAKLDPGSKPGTKELRAARLAMLIAAVVVAGVLWFGNAWWSSEDASYGRQIYKPLNMQTSLDGSGVLTLTLTDPGWLMPRRGRISYFTRSVDDLVPDHNHLMHLYAIRQPGLDVVYHLHPTIAGPGVFRLRLPAMPPGNYRLYADIVHANGFPETLVGEANVPRLPDRPLRGDDATGRAVPWQQSGVESNVFTLPDSYRMIWLRPATLIASKPVLFRFRLETPSGSAPDDMAFYMGMLGHAAFVKTDGTVFAHIHPTGSVSMTAFMMAQRPIDGPTTSSNADPKSKVGMTAMNMDGMHYASTMETMHQASSEVHPSPASALPNEVSFPYGFPSPGRYRLFVQMKHGNTVETGVFDSNVR